MTHRILIPTLSLLLLAGTAAAAPQMPEQRQPGMRHMQIAPVPQANPQGGPTGPQGISPQTSSSAPTAAPQENVEPPTSIPPPGGLVNPEGSDRKSLIPDRKALSLEKTLVKPDDLQAWSHLADVVVLPTTSAVEKMVALVEADPGAVPPQALIFLAKGLTDFGRLEDAAVYYYVAQLRITFDVARWPARYDADQIKQMQADKKKSPDQMSPQAVPKLKNPHESVTLLATSVGTPIAQWMLKDPARAEAVMLRVKAWDAGTPYGYLPGYALPPAMPYEDWPKMLASVRDGYFSRMNQFIAGLKKLKSQ